jgi:type IV secretion system protein VirB6
MDFVFFTLIYAWVTNKIDTFSTTFMQNTMGWASAIAMTLFTVWIIAQGFRILTGRSREPMMAMVADMSRGAVIVVVAATMAVGGISIQSFFTNDLASGINGLVTGSDQSPASMIDQNLAYTQLAMAAMDGAQGLNQGISGQNVAAAGNASLMAALGVAGPPMTAAALLLMYKVALALFIGLGPIFILCLLFKQTEALFWQWLKYGLGTLFSLAVLSFMVSIVLDLTLRVAVAFWSANAITSALPGLSSGPGLTSQAMQQGGIGLLMTVLLISAPPMAASFFGGTLGHFQPFSQMGGASQPGRLGPQGQAPGTYAPAPNNPSQINPGANESNLNKLPSSPSLQPQADIVSTTPSRQLRVQGDQS